MGSRRKPCRTNVNITIGLLCKVSCIPIRLLARSFSFDLLYFHCQFSFRLSIHLYICKRHRVISPKVFQFLKNLCTKRSRNFVNPRPWKLQNSSYRNETFDPKMGMIGRRSDLEPSDSELCARRSSSRRSSRVQEASALTESFHASSSTVGIS